MNKTAYENQRTNKLMPLINKTPIKKDLNQPILRGKVNTSQSSEDRTTINNNNFIITINKNYLSKQEKNNLDSIESKKTKDIIDHKRGRYKKFIPSITSDKHKNEDTNKTYFPANSEEVQH